MPVLRMIRLIVLLASGLAVAGAAHPGAALAYDNASIADKALTYWNGVNGAGSAPGIKACQEAQKAEPYPGECRGFLNCVVWMVSGHTQNLGGDYFQAFLAAGGTEIKNVDALTKGDIVQVGYGTHTYIIVGRNANGTFNVVDSNHNRDQKVWFYPRSVTLDSNQRAFRMGSVASGETTTPAPPPPPPDQDKDGTPDSADSCPAVRGEGLYDGCPAEAIESQRSPVDFNGDGMGDFCRAVGVDNNSQSRLQCTLGTASGFGSTITSNVLDWGYDSGRAWVDFNGDGRADYCRLVGGANNQSSYAQCTLSNSDGFGATVTSGVLDYGYDTGRAWVDFNGDGKVDYCRRVGVDNNSQSKVQCTLSSGGAFGATVTSAVLDWGYDTGRAWVDFNGDHKVDYCRQVGGTNNQDSHLQCTLGTGDGFGTTVTSGVLDYGYDTGAAWVDFNGDGRADYCRDVGGANNQSSYAQCTLSNSDGFGATVTSGVLDYGYDTGRAWVDFNGDGRADYCRLVGGVNNQASYAQCTLNTGSGFGATVTSGVLDYGYETGRAWVDFNGDGKVDYCRRVGVDNNSQSKVQCTLSSGSAFGATVTSGVLDWGYDDGRAWTSGHVIPPAQANPSPSTDSPGSIPALSKSQSTPPSADLTKAAAPPAPQVACIAPRLRGLTLAAARKALMKVGCTLGTIHRPKRKRRGTSLVVKSQSGSPTVSVTLRPVARR